MGDSGGSRWQDDAFLDELRTQGDPRADATVAQLEQQGGIAAANRMFQGMHADGQPLPEDTLANPAIPNSCQTCHKHANEDLEDLQRRYEAYIERGPVGVVHVSRGDATQ